MMPTTIREHQACSSLSVGHSDHNSLFRSGTSIQDSNVDMALLHVLQSQSHLSMPTSSASSCLPDLLPIDSIDDGLISRSSSTDSFSSINEANSFLDSARQGTRRVSFSSKLVTDVQERPQTSEYERLDLFYCTMDYERFRRDARIEKNYPTAASADSIILGSDETEFRLLTGFAAIILSFVFLFGSLLVALERICKEVSRSNLQSKLNFTMSTISKISNPS